jgi:hypothetical protein
MATYIINAGEISAFLEEHDFFPLLCALYQKNNRGDIKSFFKEPFNFYKGEIDDLSASRKSYNLSCIAL